MSTMVADSTHLPGRKLRALMPFGRPADEIVHDVNILAQAR